MTPERLAKLVQAYYRAALFSIEHKERHGWRALSSNYLREHVRCAFGLQFTNTDSPMILRAFRRAYPDIAYHFDIKPLKKRGTRRDS